jgi:hypothetical protein
MADSAEEWRGRIHHYLLSEGKQHLRHVASYVPRPPGCTDKLRDVVEHDSRFILEQHGVTTWLIEAAAAPDCEEEWRRQIHSFLLLKGKQQLGTVAQLVPRPPGCTGKLSNVVGDDSRFNLEHWGERDCWISARALAGHGAMETAGALGVGAAIAPAPRQLPMEDCCAEQWRCQIHSFLVFSEEAHLLTHVAKSVPRPPDCTEKMIEVVRDDPLDRFELTLQGDSAWWIAAKDMDGHAAMEADGAAPAAQWEEEWEDEFDSHG